MAQYVFSANSWTSTATADTTNLAANTYMSLTGGTTTAIHKVVELYMGGEASASSINVMAFARDSQVIGTATALTTKQSLTSLNPSSTATVGVATVAATVTLAQRDVARHLLDLSFNSFGGVVRWVAAPGSEIITVGNAAASATLGGEVSLSGFTGGSAGALSAHLIYEQVASISDTHGLTVEPVTTDRRINHRSIGAKARQARRSDEWRGLTI